MKGFVIKIVIFISIFIGTYLSLVHELSQGYVDDYYKKFTRPAGSLILGLSTASEGIVPSMIEKELKPFNFEWPLDNFALDGTQSQFGSVYLNAIKKKLKQTTSKKQLFILSVAPGSFAAQKQTSDENINNMDKKTILGKISDFTSNPNYNYIINTYGQSLYNALHSHDQWNHKTTHANGWNEVQIITPEDTIPESDMKHWKSLTLQYLNKTVENQIVSNYRKNSFLKLLAFLKSKGEVFLVRLPADQEVLTIENTFWPKFDVEMDSISKVYHVQYFNYTHKHDQLKTYDGLHLESESAKQLTKLLVADIKQHITKYLQPSPHATK